MLKIVELRIADLRLDLVNPRYPDRKSELQALQEIILEQNNKFVALAEGIANYGLSPVDRMMVLEDKKTGSYISLEGNRRTAALKVLNTPNVLDDIEVPAALKKRLKDAAAKFDPELIEPITAVEMPSRESARRWIELRHTGENEGRGIVDWTSVQSGRFRGAKEIDLLELAKLKFGVSDSVITAKFPVTTLERLIDNPEVRERVGLTVVDGKLHITRPINEVGKPLVKIINDLADKKIKVDSVKTAQQQINYINSFSKEHQAGGARLKQTRSVSSIIGSISSAPAKKRVKGPLDRTTVVPKNCPVVVTGDKPEQILYELKRINVDRTPLSCAILLRLFIEISIGRYLEENGSSIYVLDSSGAIKTDGSGNPIALKMKQRIERACDMLKRAHPGERTAIQSAKMSLTNRDDVISIQALHEYTHNSYTIPSASDLKTLWTNSTKFFELIWE